MRNLAGNKECDKYLTDELTEAGIIVTPIFSKTQPEVPYNVMGVLTPRYIDVKEMTERFVTEFSMPTILTKDYYKQYYRFTFRRAWYYWVVSGEVPMMIAKEMYNSYIGYRDIRVDGHCGCPNPYTFRYGRFVYGNAYEGRYDKESGYMAVNHYHIDSQIGLNLFVTFLKKYGLDKFPVEIRLNNDKALDKTEE